MSERVFVGWYRKRGAEYADANAHWTKERAQAYLYKPGILIDMREGYRLVKVFKVKKQRQYRVYDTAAAVWLEGNGNWTSLERHTTKFSSKAEARRAILAVCKIEEVK